jgi:ribonuclease P/MRP protein subunit RPP40
MLIRWIESFLSNRSQCVCIGNFTSSFCPVISGVPQGSVLGPVLFVIFVNDMRDCVSSKITVELFADDTKLYTTINDNLETCCDLQSCLAEIFNWADHWQLKLSPNKCAVMRNYCCT